jgi:hypothetical protein
LNPGEIGELRPAEPGFAIEPHRIEPRFAIEPRPSNCAASKRASPPKCAPLNQASPVAAVAPLVTRTYVEHLTDPLLWGREIHDERYVLLAHI